MSEPSDRESQALPGVAPERQDWAAGPRFTLEVRGETFAVTESATGDKPLCLVERAERGLWIQ
jgi:hypothetical protein